MYEYFEGKIATRHAGRVVLDVNGVGYEFAVPIGTAFPAAGERARIWTHFVVRDDAHILCGFPTRELREVFRLLLSVTGVGPVMALAILSGIEQKELVRAIAEKDAAAIVRVKGVGQKTANQILLDLGDKARQLRAASEPGSVTDGVLVPRAQQDTLRDDAVAALISIGYSEKEAKKSIERALAKNAKQDLESLLRAALAS